MSSSMQFSYFDRLFGFKTPVVWKNVVLFAVLHILAVYAFFTVVLPAIPGRLFSIFIAWLFIIVGGVGVTVGVHRMWTHRSFKTTTPVRFLLMICYLFAGQYSIVQWVKDHRTHHAYADTDADPHNAKRGFFFAHCGWLMMKRHPELRKKIREIDVSDVLADPVVQFHQKYYVPLMVIFHFLVPNLIAYYWLGEDLKTCLLGVFVFRYVCILHPIWCVNSVSHFYGYKPYNKSIKAVQNKLTAFFALGEGWHNFHHVFPWDYRIGEVGQGLQVGCYVIDALAWLGLATELKTASPELVQKVMYRNQQDDVKETKYEDIEGLIKSSDK